jgi:hypothetical protein
MKNLIIYYFLIIGPMPLLYFGIKTFEGVIATFIIFTYIFIYRPLIDGLRILQLGLIEKHLIWKAFIPLYANWVWRRELYFGK